MFARVITWPAPEGEAASPDFTVEVDGCPVFVYAARVRAEIVQHPGLWTHAPDCAGERASFAIFDIAGPVTVTVRPARPFRTAAVLPDRTGITPEMADGGVRFIVEQPRHLTVLLDDCDASPLHLFISEPETDVPRPDDPDVIYFGPGFHQVDTLPIRSGHTVYLAGGAIVQAVLRPGEEGQFSEQWNVNFYHGVVMDIDQATGVRICGRGILDGSLVPHPGHSLIRVNASREVRLSGIVLRDAPNWNVTIAQSQEVQVDDLRLVSGRLNSDGINSVNSQRVTIRRCFVRNHDDSIVVKTLAPAPPAEDIRVEDCVLWNDWGYALGATYETRAPIRRVSFRRCDILHARHWCLGVHLSDGATVSDITFADIQIADQARGSRAGGAYDALTPEPRLLNMVITEDCWGKDAERGRIRNITLDNITLYGDHPLPSTLAGFDAEHDIRHVVFRNIHLHARPPLTDIAALRLEYNAYVAEVRVERASASSP